MVLDSTDEAEESDGKKGFLDFMRIPSMFVFLLSLVVVQFATKGLASMQSEWVEETVSCTDVILKYIYLLFSSIIPHGRIALRILSIISS